MGIAYDRSLATDTTWTGTFSDTVSRSYDDNFRLASQTVAGSTAAGFAYDADGLALPTNPMGSFADHRPTSGS